MNNIFHYLFEIYWDDAQYEQKQTVDKSFTPQIIHTPNFKQLLQIKIYKENLHLYLLMNAHQDNNNHTVNNNTLGKKFFKEKQC